MNNAKSIFGIFLFATLFTICGCKTDPIGHEKNTSEAIDPTPKVNPKRGSTTINPKIPSINIQPGDRITSPLEVRVNSEGVWFAFEGEIGWVQLLDGKGNELSRGILHAEGEWMKKGPVMFSTTLNFDSKHFQSGKLIVHKNIGPGDGDEAGKAESFEVRVVL
jgi:hypothetical protein